MYPKEEQEITKNWCSTGSPVVSVCCTTFNHERFIRDAIEGFLMQETNFPFEIIIRDDCSTDQTGMIVKQYAEAYPGIIKPIFESENQYSKGVKPMPVVYKKAAGQYFSLCEGDDFWTDPSKLQKQVDFLEQNGQYIGCYHNSKVLNENGELVQDTLIRAPKDYQEMELLSVNVFITVHTVMFRNVVEFKDNLDEIPFGDMMLWHLMGAHGKVKYMPDIEKAVYRQHGGGVWSRLNQYSKFEKTLISKNIIRNKLLSNSIDTAEIDFGVRNLILRNLSEALISGEYRLYKNILMRSVEEHTINQIRLFQLVSKSILKKGKYEVLMFLKKII